MYNKINGSEDNSEMDIVEKSPKLINVLISDGIFHPERINATLERVEEVLGNVLGDNANEMMMEIREQVDFSDDRAPLTWQQAEKIALMIEDLDMASEKRNDIIEQIRCSEISTAEAVKLHREHKIPVSRLETDIVPVKGNGCWIMDTKGKWYLDMDSNYSATNLGMSNSAIATGLFNQANLLISMKESRVQIARSRFLKEIPGMMPPGLEYFYWQNSGGEAVDKAIKMAKAYTGTADVIAFKNGFHGRTHGAVAVTWNEKYRKPFNLHNEDWVHFADFNDVDSVRNIMDECGARIVILEMVQGEEGGNLPAHPDFIKDLEILVSERDGVIIDDEVQAGFGRTAENPGDWFACMGFSTVPDIMVIGKSFGGGYPVTAVVTNSRIASSMKPGYDGSTFGGNPMAMTAALIATRQMRELRITENVILRGKQLKDGLLKLKRTHPMIGEVRGKGLMLAFSIGSGKNVEKLQHELRKLGVKNSLSTESYIRLLPPTIISEDEVKEFLDKLDQALLTLS